MHLYLAIYIQSNDPFDLDIPKIAHLVVLLISKFLPEKFIEVT